MSSVRYAHLHLAVPKDSAPGRMPGSLHQGHPDKYTSDKDKDAISVTERLHLYFTLHITAKDQHSLWYTGEETMGHESHIKPELYLRQMSQPVQMCSWDKQLRDTLHNLFVHHCINLKAALFWPSLQEWLICVWLEENDFLFFETRHYYITVI